jgi:hypothetical protein
MMHAPKSEATASVRDARSSPASWWLCRLKGSVIILGTAALLVFVGAPAGIDNASAGPPSAGEGKKERVDISKSAPRPARAGRGERALRAVEQVRVRRLLRELRATEEQRRVIREMYREDRERRNALLRDRAELLRKMRGLVIADDAVGTRERERAMRELTSRFMRAEREIAELRRELDERVIERLGPVQRVRYILFNERFERELRERIERLRREGSRRIPPLPLPETTE